MNEFNIQVDAGTIAVTCPFHPDFLPNAKNLSGKWDRERHAWVFPARHRDRILAILDKLYAYDPNETTTVVVELTIGTKIDAHCDGIRILGRTLARASGRDSGAKLGPRVSMLKGKVASGGSRENWRTVISPETIFEMELPRNAAERLVADPIWGTSARIVGEVDPGEDLETLRAERERLSKELARIDVLIAAHRPRDEVE